MTMKSILLYIVSSLFIPKQYTGHTQILLGGSISSCRIPQLPYSIYDRHDLIVPYYDGFDEL